MSVPNEPPALKDEEISVCKACKYPVSWHLTRLLYDCTNCGRIDGSAMLIKLSEVPAQHEFPYRHAARPAPPLDWHPIATAPKDGRAVLLCWAIDADGKPIDYLENPQTSGVFVQVASWRSEETGWWVYISTPSDVCLHFKPTHWMPLPAPPADAAPTEPK